MNQPNTTPGFTDATPTGMAHGPNPDIAPDPGPAQPILDRMLAIVAPLTAIRHHWRTQSMGQAFLVHVYGVLLAVVGLTIVPEIYNEDGPVQAFIFELERADGTELVSLLAVVAVSAALFTCGWIALAWVLMPWGASPESWRRSMNRALARLYQLTPFYALMLVVLVLVIFMIDEAASYRDPFYNSYGQQRQPAISYQFAQVLYTLNAFVYVGVQIVVTLAAVAIHSDRPRWAAASPWPAVCTHCGYPLMGMSRGMDCPECGSPVEQSLATPRSRPDERSVYTKMWQSLRRPTAFGQTIPLYRPTTDYRRALWRTGALLLVTMPIGMALAWIVTSIGEGAAAEEVFDFDDPYEFIVGYFVFTSMTLVFALGFGLLCAAVWGTYARAFHGRNALYPAAQIFAYQSSAIACAAIGLYPFIAAIVMVYNHYYRNRGGFGHGSVPAWVQMLPSLIPVYIGVAALVAFSLQGIALRGARFGNG